MLKFSFVKRLLILVLAMAPVAASCEETAILLSVFGDVQYRQGKGDVWKKAERGRPLSEGGAVKTGVDGRAAIFFKNNSTVWLKQNTNLSLDTLKGRQSMLQLNSGSVKVRVPHLRFRERFQLRTPTTIASVRGTVFTAEANQNSELTDLDVLFGQVKLLETDRNKAFDIDQGVEFANGTLQMISRDRELDGLEDWTPDIAEGDRRAILIQNAHQRGEIRQFAQQVNGLEQEIAATRDTIKDDDFEAGRTLTDVHGNLVRVDQRLDRPDNKSVQVLNIVKRTEYNSGGLRQWNYAGPHGSRIDAMIAKVSFNEALPDKITEFPGFFSQQDKALKVDAAELVMANMGDANSVFTIGFFGKRDPNSGTDDIKSDLYVGTLTGSTARHDLFQLAQNYNPQGYNLTRFVEEVDTGHFPQTQLDSGDNPNGELYHWDARLYSTPDNAHHMWLATENWVIDNNGQVRNIKDFTEGSSNFQNLIKDTAGEVAIFAKNDSGSDSPLQTDYNANGENPNGKNIDLVFTPDLAFSIIKTLATSGDALKTTY